MILRILYPFATLMPLWQPHIENTYCSLDAVNKYFFLFSQLFRCCCYWTELPEFLLYNPGSFFCFFINLGKKKLFYHFFRVWIFSFSPLKVMKFGVLLNSKRMPIRFNDRDVQPLKNGTIYRRYGAIDSNRDWFTLLQNWSE